VFSIVQSLPPTGTHQKDHGNGTKSKWTSKKIYIQSQFTYTYGCTPMKY
jgi:hypothetical protein